MAACASASADNPGDDRPGTVGLRLDWSLPGCAASVQDEDLDSLEDTCEFAIASAFAPELHISSTACNAADEGLTGGYAFVVMPRPTGGGVRIGYAPAYVLDCGWSGAKCWIRLRGGCDGHWGDSEFIGLDVSFDASSQRWVTEAVFLSAHCFGSSDSDCRWYADRELGELEWVDETQGAPRVWVAEGKNANYPSRSRCDRGHWWFDTCDRNDRWVRFPIQDRLQNIGNPLASSACRTLAELGRPGVTGMTDPDVRECFGTERIFTGWADTRVRETHGIPVGSTPYRRYFGVLLDGPA